MSFFFFLKNKLGLISLVFAFSFVISQGHAKNSKEIVPQENCALTSQKELVFLKIKDLYYLVMVEKMLPPEDKAKEIPLNISRKKFNEIKEHENVMRNLKSLAGRDLPE